MCSVIKTTMIIPDKKFKLYYSDFPKWADVGDLYTRNDSAKCDYCYVCNFEMRECVNWNRCPRLDGYSRKVSNVEQIYDTVCDSKPMKYSSQVHYWNSTPISSVWSISKEGVLSIYKNVHKPDGVFKETTQESRDDSWFPNKKHGLSVDFSNPIIDYTKSKNPTDLIIFPITIVENSITKFIFDGVRFVWIGGVTTKYFLEIINESIMLVGTPTGGRPFQCFTIEYCE